MQCLSPSDAQTLSSYVTNKCTQARDGHTTPQMTVVQGTESGTVLSQLPLPTSQEDATASTPNQNEVEFMDELPPLPATDEANTTTESDDVLPPTPAVTTYVVGSCLNVELLAVCLVFFCIGTMCTLYVGRTDITHTFGRWYTLVS